jgi:hypothetical protein
LHYNRNDYSGQFENHGSGDLNNGDVNVIFNDCDFQVAHMGLPPERCDTPVNDFIKEEIRRNPNMDLKPEFLQKFQQSVQA